MDKVKEIMNNIKAGWEQMERSRRIRLISVVSVIFVLILTVTYFTQRTNYQVLFNDLDDEDAGTIVEDIEAKGIKYKLENNGSTILIPEEEVDNYRIELAVDGLLPTASTGFEIFDGASIMATDEDRSIMYQRAISGELEQAITSLDNIESAKVLLNIPEDSVFQNPEYSQDASASVVLEVRGAASPDRQAIQGIASLVSGAVNNLPQENVKIVDTNGNLLSNAVGSDGIDDSGVVTEHQRIKKSIEADLENKVVNLLGAIYGHDKIHVSVNTTLNFDAIEQEEIEFRIPEGSETDKGLIRSQEEHVSGNRGLSSVVEGSVLDEETVTEFLEEGEDGENDNSSYDHTTNYELDSTTSHIIQAPGTIENLSASVVIDAPQGGVNPTLLVRNALGIDAELENENIEIEFIDTIEEEDPELLPEFGFAGTILAWVGTNWWIVLIGFILLVLLIIALRMFLSRRGDVVVADEVVIAEETATPETMPEMVTPEEPEPETEKVSLTQEEIEKAEEREIANQKEDDVREQAKENPELIAEFIKIWLNEEE